MDIIYSYMSRTGSSYENIICITILIYKKN
jgi:hypothetical protein